MQWSYLESFQDSPSQYLKKSFTIPTQQKTCNKGQKYLTTDNTCNPCEDGTYQDATNHTFMDCKSHIEPICDNSFYLDTNEYAIRKNTTKDSTVNLDGLCLPQPSLNDLRGQCSGGYILETEYNKKLGTKKESRLTSAEVCKPHTQWDNKSTLGSCNETNKYYDRSQYNNIINNKKNANITLAEICLTIPYYPLNVKNGYNNYIANTNLNVFLKHNGQYLNISQNSYGLRLISSDNADKIPITWDNDTNKIQIKSGKFYAKIVGNKIEFVKQPNELPVDMRNGKLFVTGTNIEIDVNNCEDNQYRDSQSRCVTKTNTCGPGTYFSGRYGNSGTLNDPICTPCSPGTYGTGNTKCTKCEAGTYASGTGNTKCTKCEVGTYASGTGNTTREKCKIKDNLILNGFSWPRPGQNWNISKINNKMSIDECRQHVLDEKKKGNVEYDNVIVVGHRNSKHGNQAYKNTCWYIRNNVASDNTTVNAIGHVDDVHQIACVDSVGNPTKCNVSKENCNGMSIYYYYSDNLCKEDTARKEAEANRQAAAAAAAAAAKRKAEANRQAAAAKAAAAAAKAIKLHELRNKYKRLDHGGLQLPTSTRYAKGKTVDLGEISLNITNDDERLKACQKLYVEFDEPPNPKLFHNNVLPTAFNYGWDDGKCQAVWQYNGYDFITGRWHSWTE